MAGSQSAMRRQAWWGESRRSLFDTAAAAWLLMCILTCLAISGNLLESEAAPLRGSYASVPAGARLRLHRLQQHAPHRSQAAGQLRTTSLRMGISLRGGGDTESESMSEEGERAFEGELEVEAESTATEGDTTEGENATNVVLPLYQLTDSSDHDKTDEDGMPYNTNFGNRNGSDGGNQSVSRGCRHYGRGCQLVAPCCKKRFWCRHCHNEEMDVNCRDPKKAHQLDRFAIETIVCDKCELEQPVQPCCASCNQSFGTYFCRVCKFFDDDASKGHFHCDGCGICRIGGRDNFFHCANCGCCYAMQLRDNHRCIAGAMHHNCPVCLEDLFHSTSQARVLPCGHTLHKKCLEQLLGRDTAVHVCPLCKRTLVDHSFTWQQLDLAVACTPLPAELANKTVQMLCNDCHTKATVPFHVYGFKCPNTACGGYNTREIQIKEIETFVPSEGDDNGEGMGEEEEHGLHAQEGGRVEGGVGAGMGEKDEEPSVSDHAALR